MFYFSERKQKLREGESVARGQSKLMAELGMLTLSATLLEVESLV